MIPPISYLNHEINQMDINLKTEIHSISISEQKMEKAESRKYIETQKAYEFNIYKILFLSISFIIFYIRFLSMAVFEWYFWFFFQLKNIFDTMIKNTVFDKHVAYTDIHPLQEITIILNEKNLKEHEVYDLFYLIADFFSSIDVKKLNFYQQKGFKSETIGKLKEKFDYEDKNNNQIILTDNENIKFRNHLTLDTKLNISTKKKHENKRITVNFLSNLNAGKLALIDIVKVIAEKIHKKDLKLQDINKDLISEKLTRKYFINDPELLICIGPNDTLAGYSPWNLRLTEIIKISSHKKINQKSLFEIIEKYNKIEKRLGK